MEPIVNLFRLCLVCVLWTTVALGHLVTQNPLDELRAQVGGVLADAEVPFTLEQEWQIALLLEEQRQSSESLFGEIMDFSSGIPEGDQRDRALAGIQWINDEFRAVNERVRAPRNRSRTEIRVLTGKADADRGNFGRNT